MKRMGSLLSSLFEQFFNKNLELVVVGLENAGKTTLLNVLANGESIETAPTIGLNVKIVQHGSVSLKCWDLGGQSQYREEWGRYTKGCDVIVYVVDTNASERIEEARFELHRLLEERELSTTPILVAANKVDLEPHLSESEVIRELNLDYIVDNPWVVIPISALRKQNIDKILTWLTNQAK